MSVKENEVKENEIKENEIQENQTKEIQMKENKTKENAAKVIGIKKLDEKAFAKYGQFKTQLDDEAKAARSIYPYCYLADVEKLD